MSPILRWASATKIKKSKRNLLEAQLGSAFRFGGGLRAGK